MPDVGLRPDDLRAEDLHPVQVVLPRWEARKVLVAVRRLRRNRARQGERTARYLDPVPGRQNANMVDAAALARAEAAIAKALGVDVIP
jgi:hypothetical protein